MKHLGIACFVVVIAAQAASAQAVRIVAQDQKFGHGKITVIEKLTPVNQNETITRNKVIDDNGDDTKILDKADIRDMGPACITLCASEWTCGRCFTDERGRRWCLTSGAPVVEKPALMKGWIMQGDSGSIFFLHESGAIYRRSTAVIGAERLIINP